jgi:diguanylate cyclase (GGDEF)-like protein
MTDYRLYIYDNTKLYETNYKLEELNDKLKELSNCDPLTNVYNRRYFSEISNKMLSLTSRNSHDLGMIILDIDKFKNINDTYGHGVGDKVIISLAQNLQDLVRDCDIVSRFGGEEFVVLMYNITLENAQNVAEKIRQHVEKIEVIDNDLTLKFTVSLGVALYDENLDGRNLEHTLKRADDALYVAKQSGRNQVRVSL